MLMSRQHPNVAPVPGSLTIRKFLLRALLSLLALLLPGSALAQSALTDDADAQNGTTSNLNLFAGSNAYLKFKLSSTLPASTAGASVAKATIKLYIGAIKSAGKVDVYQLSSNWNEKTIASSQPSLGNLVQAGVSVAAGKASASGVHAKT